MKMIDAQELVMAEQWRERDHTGLTDILFRQRSLTVTTLLSKTSRESSPQLA
jgi:hypothetical protein